MSFREETRKDTFGMNARSWRTGLGVAAFGILGVGLLQAESARVAPAVDLAHSARVYSEWSEFRFPRQERGVPLVRETARRASNVNREANAVMETPVATPAASASAGSGVVAAQFEALKGMEAQFRAKGESAHAGYAGRSFTWTASLDEILSPNDLERVLVFKAPAVDEKWTVHLVFSLATSKVAGVKQGDRVEATAKFQERMVDDENKVITYWFADGTAKLARTAAGGGGARRSGGGGGVFPIEKPEAPAAPSKAFRDDLNGWRFVGAATDGPGATILLESKDGKPAFVKPGTRLGSVTVYGVRDGRLAARVNGQLVRVAPW